MSLITRMVIYATFDGEALARLNAWCAANDEREQQFERIETDAAGGTKVFTGEIWAMAGNYFPHKKLAEAFPTFGWRYPDDAVLLVNDEHDDATQVYRAVPYDRELGDQEAERHRQGTDFC